MRSNFSLKLQLGIEVFRQLFLIVVVEFIKTKYAYIVSGYNYSIYKWDASSIEIYYCSTIEDTHL